MSQIRKPHKYWGFEIPVYKIFSKWTKNHRDFAFKR